MQLMLFYSSDSAMVYDFRGIKFMVQPLVRITHLPLLIRLIQYSQQRPPFFIHQDPLAQVIGPNLKVRPIGGEEIVPLKIFASNMLIYVVRPYRK